MRACATTLATLAIILAFGTSAIWAVGPSREPVGTIADLRILPGEERSFDSVIPLDKRVCGACTVVFV